MGGVVVRGVRGKRANYKPVESCLAPSAEVYDVAAAFNSWYGFSEFYVADLDAIMSGGAQDNFKLLQRLRQRLPGITFMVDAGASSAERAAYALESGADKVIVATETLPSLNEWDKISSAVPADRIVVSIDSYNGGVLSACGETSRLTPAQAVCRLCGGAARECILLCLSEVGTKKGLDRQLIASCVAQAKEKRGSLFFGGGVSSLEDLRWLAANGVDGALVASIFHDAPPQPEDIFKITGVQNHD